MDSPSHSLSRTLRHRPKYAGMPWSFWGATSPWWMWRDIIVLAHPFSDASFDWWFECDEIRWGIQNPSEYMGAYRLTTPKLTLWNLIINKLVVWIVEACWSYPLFQWGVFIFIHFSGQVNVWWESKTDPWSAGPIQKLTPGWKEPKKNPHDSSNPPSNWLRFVICEVFQRLAALLCFKTSHPRQLCWH